MYCVKILFIDKKYFLVIPRQLSRCVSDKYRENTQVRHYSDVFIFRYRLLEGFTDIYTFYMCQYVRCYLWPKRRNGSHSVGPAD